MVSVTGSTRSSVVRDRQCAPELRGGRNPSLEPWSAGVPCSGVLARGRKRELSGSLATRPMPLPVPRPRPSRQNLALAIPPLLPRAQQTEGSQQPHDFGANPRL